MAAHGDHYLPSLLLPLPGLSTQSEHTLPHLLHRIVENPELALSQLEGIWNAVNDTGHTLKLSI